MAKRHIKPVCSCVHCGYEIYPTPEEAGKYLIQFRDKLNSLEHLKAAGKKGAEARWNKNK